MHEAVCRPDVALSYVTMRAIPIPNGQRLSHYLTRRADLCVGLFTSCAVASR